MTVKKINKQLEKLCKDWTLLTKRQIHCTNEQTAAQLRQEIQAVETHMADLQQQLTDQQKTS